MATQSVSELQRARQEREDRERAEKAKAGGAELPGEADDEQPGEDDEDAVQLSIEGDADLSLGVGGRKPNESVVVVQGGEISVPGGQFRKGQRVRLVFEGPIAEVHLIDRRDTKTGDVTATKRKHVMKPDTIEKGALSAPQSESEAA